MTERDPEQTARLLCFIDAAVDDQPRAASLLRVYPDLLNMRYMSETALHWLSVENYLDAVRFLAGLGFDVNTTADRYEGETPLENAVQLSNHEMAELLLELGANPNPQQRLYEPMSLTYAAIEKADARMLDILLRHGAAYRYEDADMVDGMRFDLTPDDQKKLRAVLERYGHELPEPPYFQPLNLDPDFPLENPAMSLKGRSLVTLADLNPDELHKIIKLAGKVKKKPGDFAKNFRRKTLAMIFMKPSLRTRVSFETGMTQMGGHAIYLSPNDISIGKRETTEDIAIVTSRYVDIIMARVFGHDIVEEMAKHATVPVINGLSDYAHPCQVLADLQTIVERKGKLEGLKLVYSGDGNNMAHSLMFGGALSGMHVVVVTPPGFEPKPEAVQRAQVLATGGATIETTTDLSAAAQGADVIYTDVWASMGQEDDAARRREFFMPYQVNAELMAKAKPDCTFLHCLPAHYDEEATYEVSRSENSAIFDQAENRMHAQKALMLLLAGAE